MFNSFVSAAILDIGKIIFKSSRAWLWKIRDILDSMFAIC